jgi:hypothetical protein
VFSAALLDKPAVAPKAIVRLVSLMMMAVSGCTAPWIRPSDLPERFTVARPPLVLHSDFRPPAQEALLDELAARRIDLGQRLGLPASAEQVHVYLFQNAEGFRKFMHGQHPNFPDRRAFYVESDLQTAVYAQWGDRIADDLRHEMTHAYLHAVVPNVPLWLDEGLAKYFELPRQQHGLNQPYVRQVAAAVAKGTWHPNLRRLEQLDPAGDMSQEDYVESWAWVHFLLESQPAEAELLRHYLSDLRRDAKATPLSGRLAALVGHPEWALLEHMRLLASGETGPRPL